LIEGKTMKTKLFLALHWPLWPLVLQWPMARHCTPKKPALLATAKEGKKPLTPTYPKLAGQNAAYIEAANAGHQSGVRQRQQRCHERRYGQR
jgi:hypothetical protein